ncbi:hypothetical protein ACTA71_010977 [Dictyostelium dimigraforme]
MMKLILSIILIVVCLINSIIGFKLITLITGPPSDLGWNNMINHGRIGVTKVLNIEDSRLFIVSGRNETYDLLLPIIQNDEIDLVICSSLDHGDACKEIATMYANSTKIKTQFLVRGSGATTNNLIQFTYNYASINYLSGMFAGLQTKTNKIGFISPGVTAGATDCFVYAFWLGAKNVNPNIKFYYYNIGSYLDKDKTKGAAENLIDIYDCDVIGDTLDDFTAGNVAISRGKFAIGTNGFPQRNVYGENVVYTYSYNWTKYFIPIAMAVKNKIPPSKWYADFNKDENLSLYDLSFGFQVSKETKFKIINQTKSFASYVRTLHPYFCNQYMENYTVKYNLTRQPNTTNCVTTTGFISINEPVGDMNYLGNYTIKLLKVEFPKSIQISFSIISGILIGFVIFMMFGIVKYQDTPSIRSASPFFLNLTLFGGIIVFVGIIVWVAPINTHQCNARFWLVTIGFSTLIGSLVVKNIRIWLIFDNPELKILKITNNQLFPWVGLCLLINIILMAIITSVGDLKAIDGSGIDSLGKFEYMTVCKMNSTGAATLYSILAYFATLLLVGVFVSWKIRIVHIEEFSECTAIAKTLYSISFCLFVIVPLMISPQDKQSETIILCVTGIFITTGALFIVFLPKFWRILSNTKEGSHEHFTQRKQSAVAHARAESAIRNNSSNSLGFSKSSGQPVNTISSQSLNDDTNESSLSN